MAQEQQKQPTLLVDRYLKNEKLGQGSYGAVYRAVDTKTNAVVALKKQLLETQDEGIPSSTLREISILKELPHPNVVRLLEVFTLNKKLWLVFEFIDWDLYDYLQSSDDPIDTMLIKSYLYQLIKGIEFCHSCRIIHRDLKPHNLLIDSNGGLKICDFGLARAFSVPIRPLTHEVVTRWYRAPEVLFGAKRYSTPIDIWSIGCIFAEMLQKAPLFPGDSEIDQLYQIFRFLGTPDESVWPGVTQMPFYASHFPRWTAVNIETALPRIGADGADLLTKMLRYDPKDRITAKDALNHPYFNDLPVAAIYQSLTQ